jgi:hypothetical protein
MNMTRNISPEDIHWRKECVDPGKAAAQHAQRNANRGSQRKAEHNPAQAGDQISR